MAQFFANRDDGTFEEVPAETLGAYFLHDRLGRGLARLDWNRDGFDDIVISNIDDPAALLTTTTRSSAHSITFRLIGVISERDAFCTRITVQLGDRRITRQLTAGDGYQASNERTLRFGLAARDQADQVTVEWPSGIREEFGPLTADREYLLVEGTRRCWALPESRAATSSTLRER